MPYSDQRPAKLDLRGNVAPDRLQHPVGPVYVWATLFVIWLVSLLPWRTWAAAPDMLLLTLAFWCVHQHLRVGMFTAFVFGLLMDVHDAGLLGELAINYLLVAYGATILNRRLLRFDLIGQAIHLLPVFVAARFLVVLVHAWIAGHWPGWDWLWGVLLTVVLYPVWGWLLQLPHRHDDDGESATS